MRNPNFRLRGLWPRQYGGGGAGVGSIIVSPTAPTATGYKRADFCTDADILKLRASGVLPAAISWAPSKGYGTSQSGLGIGGGAPVFNVGGATSRFFCAAGDAGWLLYLSQDDPPQLAVGFAGSSGVRAAITLTGVTGAGLGITYDFAHGQFLIATTAGMWAFSLVNKLQSTAAAITPVKFGTAAAIPGLVGQNVLFFANRWIAWGGSYNAGTPRYSNDFVTWTNCTIPVLTHNGSNQGNNINSIVLDVGGTFLVATTAYGEILTSPDGITWTKTHAEPQATNPLIQYQGMIQTPSGKLVQGAFTGTASRIYIAPNINSAFAPVTVPGAFGTSIGATYHMGVLWAFFSGGASIAAYSLDDGVTWVAVPASLGEGAFVTAGSTSAWAVAQGFIWITGQIISTTVGFSRIDTDFGRLTASYADTRTNQMMYSWVKVA